MSDLVLKWYWRYHSLEVEEVSSVNAALASLRYAQDEGSSDPDHIEVVSKGAVRRIEGDELRDMIEAHERAEYERYQASGLARPYVARVLISDGDNQATFDLYQDLEKAETEAARLSALLGERVKLVRL